MKKIKKYKYIGRNGTLISSILIDGASKIDMLCLVADKGKVLVNGDRKLYSIYVYTDEAEDWIEVEDNGQN